MLARLRQRMTGRIIQLFVAHFLRLQSGRIVELREFIDSFDPVEQVLGREIFASKPPEWARLATITSPLSAEVGCFRLQPLAVGPAPFPQ